MNSVSLPWPPAALSPNASSPGAWRKKNDAGKRYRADCLILARAAKLHPPIGKPELWLTFCPPTRHKRDLDNCLASMKRAIDAVAEVIGIDDSEFGFRLRWGDVCKGGAVIVNVEAA